MLGERAHGEKSQFGKQRWNHNLWSPFCPCRPVIPTAIKGKEREATGKSNKSRLRVDALGLTDKRGAFCAYGKVARKRQRVLVTEEIQRVLCIISIFKYYKCNFERFYS